MDQRRDQQQPPDILPEHRASDDLVKLIRKLRWMGSEEEAQRLQSQLTLRNVAAGDCVVAASHETD